MKVGDRKRDMRDAAQQAERDLPDLEPPFIRILSGEQSVSWR
jgi:hypothetical protein